MEDLFSAHQDVQAGRVPKIVQFGSGPLSLLDPTQAPPGKHTTYCWHVMPLDPDLGGRSYESFKDEFSDKIIECFARYCPNMTGKNILGRYVYTGREYVEELINMRGGDIFMLHQPRQCQHDRNAGDEYEQWKNKIVEREAFPLHVSQLDTEEAAGRT